MAAFRCYMDRPLKSQESYASELNTIKQISLNNGYYPNLVDKFRTWRVFVVPFLTASLTCSIGIRVKQHIPEARIVHKNSVIRWNSFSSTLKTSLRIQTKVVSTNEQKEQLTFGGDLTETGYGFDRTGSKTIHNLTTRIFYRLDFLEDLEKSKKMTCNQKCVNSQVNLNRSYVPLHRKLRN